MKKDDAVKVLADKLKARAESEIQQAQMLLGTRATVTPNEVNYEKVAEQMLEDAVVKLAFDEIMHNNWDHRRELHPAQPVPPLPRYG